MGLSTYEYIVKARQEDEERAREKEIEKDQNVTKSRCAKPNQVAPNSEKDEKTTSVDRYVPLVTIELICCTFSVY